MFQNVVIGQPIVDVKDLIATDDEDWKINEQPNTLFTNTRFLPAIMKEVGMVKTTSEVRKNKSKLVCTLDKLDCLWIKWGKKFLFIVVGE